MGEGDYPYSTLFYLEDGKVIYKHRKVYLANYGLEKSREISIIFGAVEMGEGDYPYSTLFYLEDGKVIYKHRKVYLANYGMFFEGRYFMSGDKIRAFDTKFGRVAMVQGEDI